MSSDAKSAISVAIASINLGAAGLVFRPDLVVVTTCSWSTTAERHFRSVVSADRRPRLVLQLGPDCSGLVRLFRACSNGAPLLLFFFVACCRPLFGLNPLHWLDMFCYCCWLLCRRGLLPLSNESSFHLLAKVILFVCL